MPRSTTGWNLTVTPLTPATVNPGASATATITATSINNPGASSFYWGNVHFSCSTNGTTDVACAVNPAGVFLNGNSQTVQLKVTTFTSVPLSPGGTPAGTYPITVTGIGDFNLNPPQNGPQNVSLMVTHSGGGESVTIFTFVVLLILWILWRAGRNPNEATR